MRRRSALFRTALAPPPRLTVSEWSDRYRMLSREASAEPGRWNTDRAPYQRGIMDAFSDPMIESVVVMSSAQIGKALSLDTPLPTPSGWTTMGDLRVGDALFDETGRPCRVTFATDVMHDRPCYRVKFSDGSELIADAEHQWYAEPDERKAGVFTTEQIARSVHYGRGRNRYAIPVAGPLDLPAVDLPVAPYVLGVWLGDGNTGAAQVTLHRGDLEIAEYLREHGVRAVVRQVDKRAPDTMNLHLDPLDGTCTRGHPSAEFRNDHGGCRECARLAYHERKHGVPMPQRVTMHSQLAALGVLGRKHIPAAYLRASREQRLALLQGLMDTDGTIARNGRCEFVSTCLELADGFGELLASLGVKFTVSDKQPRTRYKGETVRGKPARRFSFLAYADTPVFRLERKRGRQVGREGRRASETERRRIVAVDAVESVPVRCIQVDSPSHLFLAGRAMIPTHNTEILNNIVGYYIDKDPSPILVLQPTQQMGEAWSKDRLAPMLRDTPRLRGKVKDPRARDSGNTLLHKVFPGGHITISGANSAASLASRPIRIVLCDEVDRYPASAGTEGDPVGLAEKRTATFWNRKKGKWSTPTVKGFSRIEEAFRESDQRRFYLPCPHCEHLQTLRWEHLKWENGDPETAAYACEECGCLIEEQHKGQMLSGGVWVAENPGHRTAGFHINALYSPWARWPELVREFLEAKGNPERLKVFVNTVLGETWEEEGERVGADSLLGRREAYRAQVPDGVGLLVAAVDVQGDRLEVQVKGYGAGEESWLIHHEQLWGDPGRDEVWQQLEEVRTRAWAHESGAELRIAAMCIDSGGHHTENVYRYVKPRQPAKVWATKGMSQPGRPLVGRPSRSNKHGVKLLPIGTDTAKDLVFTRLRVKLPGPGYMHFPETADEEYFAQLTAEKVVTRYSKGRPVRSYEKTRPRNEALDLEVLCLAALISLGTPALQNLGGYVEKVREEGAKRRAASGASESKPEAKGVRAPVQRRRRSGFVQGWR